MFSSDRMLYGKPLAQAIRRWCAEKTALFQETQGALPELAILQVGDDPSSTTYARQKMRICSSLGITAEYRVFRKEEPFDDVMACVESWNASPRVGGIFLEHPMPPGWIERLRQALLPSKDAEGMHPCNLGFLYAGYPGPLPCTPEACIRLLEWYCPEEFAGKQGLVVGRSDSVGKAAALLLMRKNLGVILSHSKCPPKAQELKNCHVIVVSTGKKGVISLSSLNRDAYIFDVGIHVEPQGLSGDILLDEDPKEYRITPVPGGVGPVTTALLAAHVVTGAFGIYGLEEQLPETSVLAAEYGEK